MDQKKTGAFIARMRKEKGFTQAELADMLLISDKTVSKWETGKGLPEVSLMLPLCEKLDITVNELLTGAKLSPAEYQKNAEANIVKLANERSEAKFRLLVEVLVVALTLIASCTLIVVSSYSNLSTGWKIAVTCIAVVVLFGGILTAALLEMRKAVFVCRACKKRFIPTKTAYLMGAHSITTRRLKCPACGKRTWCKRVLVDSLIDEMMQENK